MSSASTIVALATPPGRGAIAVVRLSGPDAWRIGAALVEGDQPFEPRRATLVHIRTGPGSVLDQAVVLPFAAPASYTGEQVVEFSLHGSMAVAAEVIAAAVREGAVAAGPGEFTLRAFLNGRLDLAQAEAVRDLVDAATPLQARVAFDQLDGSLSGRIAAIEQELFSLSARLEASIDFPDEGYRFVEGDEAGAGLERARTMVEGLLETAARGRVIREGATVAIAGRPNVGKSSLFNRLVGSDRAIVHERPGTTRDLLTETITLGGLRVTLADTAGVRASADVVEREGVARASRAHAAADLVLLVLDGSQPLTDEDERLLRRHARATSGAAGGRRTSGSGSEATSGAGSSGSGTSRCVVVVNKTDLPPAWDRGSIGDSVAVSCSEGYGVNDLIEATIRALGLPGSSEAVVGSPRPSEAAVGSPRSSEAAVGSPRSPEEDGRSARSGGGAPSDLGSAGARRAWETTAAVVVTNVRHVARLEEARSSLDDALRQLTLDPSTPEEVVLSDIRRAREALEEVTGKRAGDALLHEIFSSFCVGK